MEGRCGRLRHNLPSTGLYPPPRGGLARIGDTETLKRDVDDRSQRLHAATARTVGVVEGVTEQLHLRTLRACTFVPPWSVMAYLDFLGDAPPAIEHSPSETTRFAFSVGRLAVGERQLVTDDELVKAFATDAHELVVFRYPSNKVTWAALLRAAGFDVLQADTLLYYRLDAQERAVSPTALDYLEATSPGAVGTGEKLLRGSFDGYANHYAANPRFSMDSMLDGYVEWALRCTQASVPGALLVHTDEAGAAVGASTVQPGEAPEVPLVAIRPGAAGRGLYGRVLAGAEHWLFSHGATEIFVSTQSHNIPVLRTWARRNYRLVGSFNTVHVSRATPGNRRTTCHA